MTVRMTAAILVVGLLAACSRAAAPPPAPAPNPTPGAPSVSDYNPITGQRGGSGSR